jgi:ligand-binding sensor domain-containing protein
MSFTNFNTAHGLPNNLVHCLAQDADGRIWIGTHGGGVSIYDAYAFANMTTLHGLASDIVYGLTVDSRGNMWITVEATSFLKLPETMIILCDLFISTSVKSKLKGMLMFSAL